MFSSWWNLTVRKAFPARSFPIGQCFLNALADWWKLIIGRGVLPASIFPNGQRFPAAVLAVNRC